MFKTILAVLLVGISIWAYRAIQPPPPKICGSPDGPPVTTTRVKLRDGRHLSYMEYGLSKDTAKYKIIFVHGIHSCRYDCQADLLSQVLKNSLFCIPSDCI